MIMVATEREVKCPTCLTILGMRVGPPYAGLIAIRGRAPGGGRQPQETLTGTPVAIRCECGGVWRPEQISASNVLADLETKAG